MPRKRRDYRAEYRRRIARSRAKGLSRSQARGHPRASEAHVSGNAGAQWYNRKFEGAVRAVRQGKSLTAAAREQRVSPERLRRFMHELGFAEKRGRRWFIGEDPRLRSVVFYSNGKRTRTVVQGYEPAALAGSYWNAVGEFLKTNDPKHLAPFIGAKITDANGKVHTLETRPNVLYRLVNTGGETFEQIYKIII